MYNIKTAVKVIQTDYTDKMDISKNKIIIIISTNLI